MRQRLQIEPVELATPPNLLYHWGNRFTGAQGEHDFRRAALNDLLCNECRHIIEQMHVSDSITPRTNWTVSVTPDGVCHCVRSCGVPAIAMCGPTA